MKQTWSVGGPLARALLITLAALITLACDEEAPEAACGDDRCPRFSTCDVERGRCVIPEDIDPARVDSRPSLALTPEGAAVVSAYVSSTGDLAFGVYDDEARRFRFRTIATEGDVGRHNAIALDPDGRPGILYYDASRSRLMYARLEDDDVSWRFEVVDDTASVGVDIDLVFDRDGHEHASYRDITGRALRYASRDDNFWQPEFVDTGADQAAQIPEDEQCPREQRDTVQLGVGYQSHIAAQGTTPIIAYYDADCGALRIARRTADGWTLRVLAGWDPDTWIGPSPTPPTQVGRFNDLGIDPVGNVVVTYHDATRGELRLALVQSGTGAVSEERIDDGLRFVREGVPPVKKIVGQMPALLIDSEGVVMTAHLDANTRNILFSTREGDTWTTRTLGDDAPEGFWSDAAIGPDDSRVLVGLNTLRARSDSERLPIELVVIAKPQTEEAP